MKTIQTARKFVKFIGISLVLLGIALGSWTAFNQVFTDSAKERYIQSESYQVHEHNHGDDSLKAFNYSSSDEDEEFSHPIIRNEQIYDSENFRIHYTLRGEDKVDRRDDNDNGVPDYVEDIARTAEEVKAKELALGWAHPPKDGNWGGNDLYDIYLLAETEGGGFVDGGSGEAVVGDNPFTPNVKEINAALSYMALPPEYQEDSLEESRDYLKVLIAHEYLHAIQFGYDAEEPNDWFWEGGANWIEERLYDRVNSPHETLESVFKSTDSCQASYGGEVRIEDADRVYGMWVYWQYLAERYHPDMLMLVWEEARFKDNYEALDAVLKPYGTDSNQSLKDFAVAMLTRDFEEGREFPTVRLEATVTEKGFTANDGVGQLAADILELDFKGEKNIELRSNSLEGQVVGIRNKEASVFDVGRTGATIDASQFDKLYLVVFNPERPSDEASCSISNYSVALTDAQHTMTSTKYMRPAVNFSEPQVEGLEQESRGFFGSVANALGFSNDVTTIYPPTGLVPSYLPASLTLAEAYKEMYEGSELTVLEYLSEDEEKYMSIVAEQAPADNLREIFELWDYDLEDIDSRKVRNQTVFFETFEEDGESVELASLIKDGQFLEVSSNMSKAQLTRVIRSLF